MDDLVKFQREIKTAFDLFDKLIFADDWFRDERGLFPADLKRVDNFYGGFPPINVKADKDRNLTIEFAVAGYKENEIELTFEGDFMYLSIKAEEEKEEDGVRYISRGIRRSKTNHKYYIPASKYNTDAAKAGLEDGMLTIEIPVSEKAKVKKLLISKA